MQILTVVIGIIFVLLLLSMLATTLMELIASFFSLRGQNLIKALRNMLASSDEHEVLLDEFKNNSLYRQLTEQYGRRSRAEAPSYMSAETFQSILFDVILKDAPMDELGKRIEALPDKDIKNVLQQLLRESGGQLDIFRLEVQNWYNNVMERAGGWYKRATQKILIFLGLGIAILFNADTVSMYERLSSDPERAELVASLAQSYIAGAEKVEDLRSRNRNTSSTTTPPVNAPTPGVENSLPGGSPVPATADSAFTADSVSVIAPGLPVNSVTSSDPTPGQENDIVDTKIDSSYLRYQQNMEEFRNFLNTEIESVREPLGLGWEGTDWKAFTVYDVITKLLGFLLTALAISLGAPFWFDLLKKIVNVRSAGEKP